MLTIPVSVTASSAASADEDLAYLQNTTPFVAIRSVLQYCRSRKLTRCACNHRMGFVVLHKLLMQELAAEELISPDESDLNGSSVSSLGDHQKQSGSGRHIVRVHWTIHFGMQA